MRLTAGQWALKWDWPSRFLQDQRSGTRGWALGRIVCKRRLCTAVPQSTGGDRDRAVPRAVGLAWDLETTGYQPCEIVQIAVTCADWDDEPHSSFVRYVMPSVAIDPRAEKVHGISIPLLVEQRAQSLAVVLTELASWLDSTFGPERRLVWAAHNGKAFDQPVLRKAAAAAGCAIPRGLEASAHTVDTLLLARRTLQSDSAVGSHKLSDLYRLAAGRSLVSAHDALADAKAVATVSRR